MSNMVKTTWQNGKYYYFMTSDGHLYAARRNLEREADEARHRQAMYWIDLMNRAMLYFFCSFVSVDIVFLGLLIGFSLLYGGA
jgi:hypothetical protein